MSKEQPVDYYQQNQRPYQPPSDRLKSHSAPMDYAILHQRCVCELCTCGKHHCPLPKLKGSFQTSYNDHYKEYAIQVPASPIGKCQYEMRHYNPDQLKSNYQETYVKKEMPIEAIDSPSRFESIAKKMILSPRTKFNGSTSYAEHYKEYQIKSPVKFEGYSSLIPKPIKFQGTSSYKSSYLSPPPRAQPKCTMVEYQRVTVPFKGESTYKNHFTGHKFDPPHIEYLKEVPVNSPQSVKFKGKTAYQEQYDLKTLQKAQTKRACICELLNIPVINHQDKPHLRYDVTKNQWI